MQPIANTAPDLPPKPEEHAGVARDHEYKSMTLSACLPGSI
jgi:hypothetical protein